MCSECYRVTPRSRQSATRKCLADCYIRRDIRANSCFWSSLSVTQYNEARSVRVSNSTMGSNLSFSNPMGGSMELQEHHKQFALRNHFVAATGGQRIIDINNLKHLYQKRNTIAV